MQRLRLQLAQYANLAFPVLIEGESGSGKDIVASHYLHRQTERRGTSLSWRSTAPPSRPACSNRRCSATPRAPLPAPPRQNPAISRTPTSGTLFLDEIGELPLDLQPKLLRVLENGEYQRVGETQTRVSKARIIAATNRDLRQEMRPGASGPTSITACPCSQSPSRRCAKPAVTACCCSTISANAMPPAHCAPPFTLDARRPALWLDYTFPGNVRELRNIVIRLTARYAGQKPSAPNS
jgi:DNA-binding NtrC family response regulator